MKTLYLIRHGKTAMNITAGGRGCFSGSTDVSISEEGVKQAEKLRDSGLVADAQEIYVSRLSRSLQTAETVFGKDRDFIRTEGIQEVDFGEYEGRIFSADSDDPVITAWLNSPAGLVFPGGDSLDERMLEVYSVLCGIMSSTVADRVAVVSHATAIRLFLSWLKYGGADRFRSIICENCSVTTLAWDGESFSVEGYKCLGQ